MNLNDMFGWECVEKTGCTEWLLNIAYGENLNKESWMYLNMCDWGKVWRILWFMTQFDSDVIWNKFLKMLWNMLHILNLFSM